MSQKLMKQELMSQYWDKNGGKLLWQKKKQKH